MEYVIKGLPVYYEEIGSGKPVLCIHGYVVDNRLMKGCMEPIFEKTQGYKRIYIDLLGMGRTPAKPWIQNADDMLQIVIDFCKKIIPNENFLVAGESYGGYLELGLIRELANKIDGALFICPVAVAKHSNRVLPGKSKVEMEPAFLDNESEDINSFLETAVVATQPVWERYKEEVLPGIQYADKQFTNYFQQNGYMFSFEQELKKINFEKPVCILTGKQDNVVGYKDIGNLLDCFPNATFLILDKAGHNLQLENETIFNTMVENWLKRTMKVTSILRAYP